MANGVDAGELQLTSFAGLCVALTALGAIAVADGWRAAALTLLASGAVLMTRLRFSGRVAVSLMAVVAILALGGRGIASDERPHARAATTSPPVALAFDALQPVGLGE